MTENIKVNLFQAEFSSLSIPVDGIVRYKSGHQHYHHQFLFIKRVALKNIPLCINISASPCADIISSTVAHSSVFLNWCAKSSSWVFTASSSKPIFSCGKDRAPQNNVIISVRSQQIHYLQQLDSQFLHIRTTAFGHKGKAIHILCVIFGSIKQWSLSEILRHLAHPMPSHFH